MLQYKCLLILKSFEQRGVQNTVFEDYTEANQIAESGDYAKIFSVKYWESLKIMSNEYLKITLHIFNFFKLGDPLHQVSIKLE